MCQLWIAVQGDPVGNEKGKEKKKSIKNGVLRRMTLWAMRREEHRTKNVECYAG